MPVPLWAQLLFQVCLILIAAAFSYAEAALTEGNDKKLEKSAEEGDRRAAKAMKAFARAEYLLPTIRIGLFTTGFLGVSVASVDFAARLIAGKTSSLFWWTVAAILIAITVFSLVFLVFGVFVPRRLAGKRPEKAAIAVSGFISGIAVLTKPFVWTVTSLSDGVLRLFRIDPKDTEETVTEEKIRLMVDAGEEDGNIETGEREMIENIFEFNNTTAADIMVHRTEMYAIEADEDTADIRRMIDETGFSRFPVYEKEIDNIIGILSTRSFLLNLCSDDPKPLRELIYEPYFVPESVRADALFRDMQEKKSHMAIVLDEYGGTSGLITMEDLLEQIVGNIYDETDEQNEPPEIEKLSEELYRIQGTASLEAIEEALSIRFSPEDDEYSTLSGLIFSRFTTIPADGETPELTVDRLRIQVEKITEHRVISALVEVLPEEEEDAEREEESE